MENYQEKVSEKAKAGEGRTKFLEAIKKLDVTQKISLALLLFILVSLPLSIVLAGSQTFFRPRANTPTTPPVTSPSTPTPTTIGSFPVITTESLESGEIGKMYNQRVEGHDQDEDDSLIMTAENLPPGLEFGKCKSTGKYGNNIRCDISGKPETQGRYSVLFRLTDNNGYTAARYLFLNISE